MRRVTILLSLLVLVSTCSGQQFTELLPGNATRLMAIEAIRNWISTWDHPDRDAIASAISDDVHAFQSQQHIFVGGVWYTARVSPNGTVIQFIVRPKADLPVPGRPKDASAARQMAEGLLSTRKTDDWRYRIYSGQQKNGRHGFAIHCAMTRFPNVYSSLDISRGIHIDATSGYVSSFDVPAAPNIGPVDPAQVRIRFTEESLRARALAAYGAFRPFAQAVPGHAGLVFRVPKFSNFTHWMTNAHHTAAGTNCRMAMYQLNVFSAEPDMPQQIIWIDAETGNLIAIRELNLHFMGGADKSVQARLATTDEVLYAVRSRHEGFRVGIRAANGVIVSGKFDENLKRFRPNDSKIGVFKPSSRQVNQIRAKLNVPTMLPPK